MRKLLIAFTLLFNLCVYAQAPLPSAWFNFPTNCIVVNTGYIGGYPLLGCSNVLFSATNLIYADVNRTDSYTPTGSAQYPYKSFSSALASATGAGPYALVMVPGNYTESVAISGPTAQLLIYANNSTLTDTAGIILNGPATIYDLNTVGPVTYAYTGAIRSERHGGSYTGGNVIINGFVHWYGVQASASGGAYTCTVNGTLAGDFTTGGMEFISGGVSSFIALNNSNLQRGSGYNFDMTAGGLLALNGGYLSTASGTYNINLPTANTLATSHAIQATTFVSGLGLSAGSGTYYAYDNLSLPPVGALGYAFNRVGSSSTHPAPVWYMTGQIGPAIAPSGTGCTAGTWAFSQDGHATYCNAGTWATKI
jgi:hypothetical protein